MSTEIRSASEETLGEVSPCGPQSKGMIDCDEYVLTVICPAYCVEQYLPKALDSVNVFSGNLEVIIVNDGSTDGTLDIAKQYTKSNPKVFKLINKDNGHWGSAINEGLKIAKGKYCRILDCDDFLINKNVEAYINFLNDCEYDVVYSPRYDVEYVSQKMTLCDPLVQLDSGEYDINNALFTKTLCTISQLAYRTSMLKEVPLEITEGCSYTDIEFAVLALVRARSVYVTHKPLYCRTRGIPGQSISLESSIKNFSQHKMALYSLLGKCQELGLLNPPIKRVVLDYASTFARYHYYKFFLLPSSAKNKKLLVEFDDYLKKYPAVYEEASKSKRISLLRATKFNVYSLFCVYSAIKHRLLNNEA